MKKIEVVEKLRQYRLEKGLTQQKLSDSLGINIVLVNRWFKHKSKPSEINVYKIEKLLDVK